VTGQLIEDLQRLFQTCEERDGLRYNGIRLNRPDSGGFKVDWKGQYGMITVRVLFFATIRALIGKKEMLVKLPSGSSVRDLKLEIARKFPHTDQAVKTMLASVNQIFSDDDTQLADQAVVAFFPHVSGG